MTQRVYIASDHAGYELKEHLRKQLGDKYEIVDCGADQLDPQDDYPAFCLTAGSMVADDPGSLGVVIGGSGNGEQIAANKVHGIRAALAWSEETAQLAREHNDANVVGIGARMHSPEEATAIVEKFLEASFSGEERHLRRIQQITNYESAGS